MREVKYFDNITGEYTTINVSNAVADAMDDFDERESKQQNPINNYEFSVDEFEGEQQYIKENIFIDNSLNPYEALEKKEGLNDVSLREVWLSWLKDALRQLTKQNYLIIKKKFWQNYKQIEIAREFKMSSSTVSYRYKNSIKKLKDYLIKKKELKVKPN